MLSKVTYNVLWLKLVALCLPKPFQIYKNFRKFGEFSEQTQTKPLI